MALLRAFLIAAVAASSSGSVTAAESTPPANCNGPEYHQFDFWLGDWDTYKTEAPGQSTARNHVDAILGGCVLREDYEKPDGYHGQSFSIYDASRKLWHQTWVSNTGELLVIEGRFEDRRLVLEGRDRDAKGEKINRATWEPQGDDVREIATMSRDGGKTWAPVFDLVFRRHRDKPAG